MSIYVGSDTLVTLDGLYDLTSLTYPTTATVSAVLKDSNNNTISTISLVNVQGNGKYQGSYPAATTSGLTVGSTYYVIVTATSGGTVLQDKQAHTAIVYSS